MIISYLTQITALEKELRDLDDQTLLYKPTAETWNIQEVLEHILKVESAVLNIILSDQANGMQESSVFSENQMREMLENRTTKYIAPERFAATNTEGNTYELLNKLTKLRENIQDVSSKINLLAIAAPHPRLGKMTKEDWLNFIVAHFNRHLAQIKDLIAINVKN